MRENKAAINNTIVRKINQKQVISCIKTYGPMPRVEICEKTGLSKPTVTRLIDQLLKDGLIIETDRVESNRGRYPVNVDINASARYCFGINLSKHTLRAALIDLKMNIIEKRVISIKNIVESQELLETIGNAIQDILDSSKVEQEKVLGAGVGAPGLVDYTNGIIKNFALGGRLLGIPLKAYLENRFGFQVLLDNNCNTMMLGEYWYGYATNCKNAMFVINSEGVGCGLLMNERIYSELNNTASGLGHISVSLRGKKCSCGGTGCIETFCSTDAIEQKVYERIETEAANTSDSSLLQNARPSYKDICKAIDEGDMKYAYILMEAAFAMACGLVNMINLFSPEIIILSGNLFDECDFYYNMVISEVKMRIGYEAVMPKIVRRRVKDTLYEIGAATMILQEVF